MRDKKRTYFRMRNSLRFRLLAAFGAIVNDEGEKYAQFPRQR